MWGTENKQPVAINGHRFQSQSKSKCQRRGAGQNNVSLADQQNWLISNLEAMPAPQDTQFRWLTLRLTRLAHLVVPKSRHSS